jgi:hypothetical protein
LFSFLRLCAHSQLEKWKSAGYVILRAIREKLKPFIYGSRHGGPGLADLIDKVAAAEEDDDAAKRGVQDASALGLKVNKVECTPAQIAAEKAAAKRAAAVAAAAQPAQEASASSGGKKKANSKNKKRKAKEQAAAALADATAAAIAMEALSVAAPPGAAAAAAAAADAATAESGSDDGDEKEESDVGAAAASSTVPSVYLEFQHPEIDLLGSVLSAEEGGHKVPSSTSAWRVRCPASAEGEAALRARVAAAYEAAVLQRPFASALKSVTERVVARIKAIDHVPMNEQTRARWIADAAEFLRWIQEQIVVHRRWPAKEVMNSYSMLWATFREERERKAAQSQQAQA